MANFDSNTWYQLTVNNAKGDSMYGTSLFDHGLGSVFFQVTNTTLNTEQWQIYPYNSSVYMLRSKDSGHDGYLATAYSVNETTPGNTRPTMRNYTLSDNSMFWQISPWGDGTFYFTNLENGTAWHMQVKVDTLMAMNSNITAPQDGQSFSFTSLGSINDQAFSTVNTPAATATSTSSSAPSKTKSPGSTSSSSSSSSKGGLSSGAAAAIGASIGAVAIIIILAIAFIWYRRRKRRQLPAYTDSQPPLSEVPVDPPKHSYYAPPPPAELQAPPNEHAAELHGESWNELEGDTARPNNSETKSPR